jgi:hypothetical protein
LAEYEGTATLWLRTADSESDIYRVRAILINPNYQLSDYLGQDTDFSRIELKMDYSPTQQRYETIYHDFCREAGDWRIRYQVQNHEGAWSEVAEGVVTVPTACPSATVKMLLNSNRYTTADQVRLDMELNGRASVDLYVAILFPDGYYITIAYPLAFGWPGQIQTYQPKVEITDPKTYPILDIQLPSGIPTGSYKACGVLVQAGNQQPGDFNNWIHSHCTDFEVY